MSPDVVVIGGGVIGCAVARELARAGVGVTVVERDRPGAHASWAAAGMLTPLAESDRDDPLLHLLRASRARFPAFAEALREETGIDVEYRDDGTLLLALTEADEAELEARWAWQSGAGLPVERLDPDEARRLEPALTATVRGALRFPEDHQVDNRRLAQALWRAAEAAGAGFRLGGEAVAVVSAAGRVAGVRLRDGTTLTAARVVVAAGCWAAGVEGLPRPLPVHPVRGQLLAFEAPPPLLRHVLATPRGYLVPRRGGPLIAGTTVEDAGFEVAVTEEAGASIRAEAVRIAPELRERPLAAHWAGLRPGTPDERPILGSDPDASGLLYATGHYRNGILLAPITGELIAALARDEDPGVDLGPFSIGRF